MPETLRPPPGRRQAPGWASGRHPLALPPLWRYLSGVGDLCQYCGADLGASPPGRETGWLYGLECSRCPPGRRRSLVLARPAPVDALTCPDCGAAVAPADAHPDVLVVKEMTYDVCPACGERCGVAAVRKVRDVSGGTM